MTPAADSEVIDRIALLVGRPHVWAALQSLRVDPLPEGESREIASPDHTVSRVLLVEHSAGIHHWYVMPALELRH